MTGINESKLFIKYILGLSTNSIKFNKIHEVSIFAFFLWAIFAECSILLMLQFQLVEYLFRFFCCISFSFYLMYLFKVGWWFKADWDHLFIHYGCWNIHIHIFGLWTWWANDRSFCMLLWWNWTVRLAFVVIRFKTIVFGIFVGCSTINLYSMLWWHFVHTRHI